jgi:threonyl-tRNA synthetase
MVIELCIFLYLWHFMHFQSTKRRVGLKRDHRLLGKHEVYFVFQGQKLVFYQPTR